jgi:hypothetical protein
MTTIPTFTATLYVGFKDRDAGTEATMADVLDIIQQHVTENSRCVSVTPTTFVYRDGRENGAAIGLINYPRFPTDHFDIRTRAITLGYLLMSRLRQYRVSIVMGSETILLSDERALNQDAMEKRSR